MKKFINPELDINKFDREAVLTASAPEGTPTPDPAQIKMDDYTGTNSGSISSRYSYWNFTL